MIGNSDKATLIEPLLQERDELYQELSKLREIDNEALEKAEATIQKQAKDLQEKGDKIKQLIDQLGWYRRKLWKSGSEKYIPQDPDQRKIEFDGPEE